MEAPPDGSDLVIHGTSGVLELTGNYENVSVYGGSVTFRGDTECLILWGAPDDPGAIGDITVYGDLDWLSIEPEWSTRSNVYCTGSIRWGSVIYHTDGGEAEYFAFSHTGDGETLVQVVENGQALYPLFPTKMEGISEQWGGTLETITGDVAVTPPPVSALPDDSLAFRLRRVTLTTAQQRAVTAQGRENDLYYTVLTTYSIALYDRASGEPAAILDTPVTVRFDAPDFLRAEGTTFHVLRMTEDAAGGITVTGEAAFTAAEGGTDIPFDGTAAVYVVTRTGNTNIKLVLTVAGGAVAALLLGGIIAASVVRKKERARSSQ